MTGAFSRDGVEDSWGGVLVAILIFGLLLRLFSVNSGLNIALVKLLFALTLAHDEVLHIWSQMLLENRILLLLDSPLRPDSKLLFGRISTSVATRLT